MIYLFLVMIIIFFGYIGYIWNQFGILPSISDSYYHLPKNQKILFTFFCWGFAFPVIIIGNSALMFLAGSAITFVGAAPAFKETLTKTVHFVGALIGILAAQLSIFFDYKLLYVNIIFILISLMFLIFKKLKSHRVWWIEIAAFLSIVYTLAINFLS